MDDSTKIRNGYKQEDWARHYSEHDLTWDIAEPSPPLVRLWNDGKLKAGKVLAPGCGQGHEVVFFAERGFEVVAVDYVPAALELAGQNLKKKNLTARLLGQSFFDLDSSHDGSYDWMFEQTFFCAIDLSDRTRYVQAARRILKPGGVLVGLFYETGEEGGPPWNTTEENILESFSDGFAVECLEKSEHSTERRQGREWLAWLRKK